MTHTEPTMTTTQETNPQNPPVRRIPIRRVEIKTDGKGPKLYYYDPVCDYCKVKKIACHHRDIYDEFGNLVQAGEKPPKLDPQPASGQAKKVARKVNKANKVNKAHKDNVTNQSEITGIETGNSSQTTTASQRPRRGNVGKRKLDNITVESATANDSKRQKTERKKPGRKPRQRTPIPIVTEDTEAEPLPVSSPATEPSVTPVVTQQPRGGNLDNSMDMAWHRGMTTLLENHISNTAQKWKVLKTTIDQAEKQWEEVQQSMRSTKNFINEWISRFAKSDASTL